LKYFCANFKKIQLFIFLNSKWQLQLYTKEVSFKLTGDAGVKLIKIISDLWYDKSIEMVLFRNQLLDRNVSDINPYEYAAEFVGTHFYI
jgi:hypothetical protein